MEDDDGRGFTTAGKGYETPKFEKITSSSPRKRRAFTSGAKKANKSKIGSSTRLTTTTTTTPGKKMKPFPLLPAPIAPIAPEELDLDSTIEAQKPFQSSDDSEGSDEDWGVQGRGRGNSGANGFTDTTVGYGNGTSYSKAIRKGRIESVSYVVCVFFQCVYITICKK